MFISRVKWGSHILYTLNTKSDKVKILSLVVCKNGHTSHKFQIFFHDIVVRYVMSRVELKKLG